MMSPTSIMSERKRSSVGIDAYLLLDRSTTFAQCHSRTVLDLNLELTHQLLCFTLQGVYGVNPLHGIDVVRGEVAACCRLPVCARETAAIVERNCHGCKCYCSVVI